MRGGETVWPSGITEDPKRPSRGPSMDLIGDLAARLTGSLLKLRASHASSVKWEEYLS